ncbi:Hypothetical predicted protein, partial [Pelobates cultripes]
MIHRDPELENRFCQVSDGTGALITITEKSTAKESKEGSGRNQSQMIQRSGQAAISKIQRAGK